jgi:hypothetical protein
MKSQNKSRAFRRPDETWDQWVDDLAATIGEETDEIVRLREALKAVRTAGLSDATLHKLYTSREGRRMAGRACLTMSASSVTL